MHVQKWQVNFFGKKLAVRSLLHFFSETSCKILQGSKPSSKMQMTQFTYGWHRKRPPNTEISKFSIKYVVINPAIKGPRQYAANSSVIGHAQMKRTTY